jgi:hypothetical protein
MGSVRRRPTAPAVPLLLVVAFAAALVGCGGPGGSDAAGDLADADVATTITVRSGAFAERASIPTRFTCDGENVSPPLTWTGVPADAASLALVVDDPDAPKGTYVHWVLGGLAPDVGRLEEGSLPAGAVQADNSAGDAAYKGPCPPGGSPHHYRFTVYALDAPAPFADGAGTTDALEAIRAAAVARGTVTATYAR